VGVPAIVISVVLLGASVFWRWLLFPAAALFVLGWGLQFLGHAIEGKRPAFTSDPRFLFLGVAWWWREVRGKGSAQR